MPKPKPSPPPLIDADLHAESFRQVREAHRVELVEDYVELISDLIRDGGEARQVDIAARLGVAQPTVAKMLKRLVKAGFVVQKPYRGAFLTPRSEEHTSELQSLMRISYAVFCLKKKTTKPHETNKSKKTQHDHTQT